MCVYVYVFVRRCVCVCLFALCVRALWHGLLDYYVLNLAFEDLCRSWIRFCWAVHVLHLFCPFCHCVRQVRVP
jgi:hypothetical protein